MLEIGLRRKQNEDGMVSFVKLVENGVVLKWVYFFGGSDRKLWLLFAPTSAKKPWKIRVFACDIRVNRSLILVKESKKKKFNNFTMDWEAICYSSSPIF